MNAYTMSHLGITAKDGKIQIGQEGRGRKQVSLPIPEGAVVEGDKLISLPGPEEAIILYIHDQSGFRGSWRLRAGLTSQEWDQVVAHQEICTPDLHGLQSLKEFIQGLERPFQGKVVAEGASAQGDAGQMGGGPEYLLVLQEGEAVECVRWGRLYDAPAVIRLANIGEEVKESFPWKDAEDRLAAAKLAAVMK